MNRSSVSRVLMGVLIFQLGIGVLLIVGDMQGNFRLPSFGPDAPQLTEPVRPGDQRRQFSPGRDMPRLDPDRDAGDLPTRLTLTTTDTPGLWRLEGAIEYGDADRIADQIAKAESPLETLILQSPGGSVRDALTLGRILRRADVATRVLQGEYCFSACPYLFAGGTDRSAEDGAAIGLHQHYFGKSTILPAFIAVEDIQRGQGEVMVYLDEMGINPLVMQHALTTPADEIYVLLPEELTTYRMVTDTN